MAVWPAEGEEGNLWTERVEEAKVSQDSRQEGFDNHTTTDDHLMHIVGLAPTDQDGKEYFIIKNSWGEGNMYGGRQYVSMAYFKAKTIAVTLHQDAMQPKKKALIFVTIPTESIAMTAFPQSSKELQKLWRSRLFYHLDGLALSGVVPVLEMSGVLEEALQTGGDVDEMAALFGANAGYLNVGMRMLCSQGILEAHCGEDRITYIPRKDADVAHWAKRRGTL